MFKCSLPSVLWCCWLGSRKGIWPVKKWRFLPFTSELKVQLHCSVLLYTVHICVCKNVNARTHTQPFNGRPFVRDCPGRPVPEETFTHSHPSWSSDILYELPPSTTIHSILLVLFVCLTVLSTTSLQVLFGLPVGLGPSTSYSMHFFTQSLSSFRSTCQCQRSLFCCNTNVISSLHNLSPSSHLGNLSFSLMPHIHLTILICACWSATTFSFLIGQVSLPCNILLRTHVKM